MFSIPHCKAKVPARFPSIRNRVRAIFLPACLLLITGMAMGATHYVLPSPGTGAHNGSDWANACSGFTGSCAASGLVRGDTYYVGRGNYAAPTFNAPESGTTTLTIKGATFSEHGTATGWSDSLGVDSTPAKFAYPFNVYTGYQVIDGATGNPSDGPGSYGFAVALPSSCGNGNAAVQIGAGGSTVNNVQISHFYLLACSGDVETSGIYLQTTTTASNHTYSYNYMDGFEAAFFDHATGTTIDHNYLLNAYSSPNHHGNQFDFIDAEVNPTISNNQVLNCAGTVCIGANDNGSVCSQGLTGAKIYGNVFNAALPPGGTQAVGDGIIGATSRCYIANMAVYNNTFTGTTSGGQTWVQGCVAGQSTCSKATGNVAENNIVWHAICAVGSNIQTADYNSFLSCIDSAPTEAHGQVANLNPFVNPSANNFQVKVAAVASCAIAAELCAGVTLSNAFSVDPVGAKRGSGGTWERGAYEFANITVPLPPTGLAAIVQ